MYPNLLGLYMGFTLTSVTECLCSELHSKEVSLRYSFLLVSFSWEQGLLQQAGCLK